MSIGVNIRLTDFNTPDVDELKKLSDDDVMKLLDYGKAEWSFEINGYIFHFGSLWEWELNDVFRKIDNLDLITKEQVKKVEILTLAIIGLETPNKKKYVFRQESDKVTLRHLLLSLSPVFIDTLYSAYDYGQSIVINKFNEEIGEIDKRIKSDFFV